MVPQTAVMQPAMMMAPQGGHDAAGALLLHGRGGAMRTFSLQPLVELPVGHDLFEG